MSDNKRKKRRTVFQKLNDCYTWLNYHHGISMLDLINWAHVKERLTENER